ncbi:MAG TPA: serine acetyltransferase [Cytophagales bacterium]|nr:serine acetyltransferase [Cytophagales bacterium]HAA17238.1 serine acetyltransferase [Cytophagales bacterium]HAP63103.1 serine acetyltransferase [Cytophagales bacterium]
MDRSFIQTLYQAHHDCPDCPSPERVAQFFQDVLGTLFPDFQKFTFQSEKEFELHIQKLQLQLEQILYRNPNADGMDAEAAALEFFQDLPHLRKQLQQDAQAMYAGDPAAKSMAEVIRTYPGFLAIGAYRIAHRLHRLGIPLVPRLITEFAHSKTGIDIHPGARIGDYFCIDHGTGVVIGETTVIGNHVKVYQGVTLGALSVTKEDANAKRHPTLEDHVVIYAGATILGGETTVGQHSVIGGNVWLTRSVPAHSKLYYKAKMHNSETDEIDTVVFRGHAS